MVDPIAKVVAFVHAKGQSERLPGKNLRILGDRPLICHAIANALAAELVDAVVIDSDSDEILRVGEEAGAIPLKRPAELATNKTTGDDLAHWQASNVPDAEIVVQVVPTCPFISPGSIDRAIADLVEQDSVVGMREERLYRWKGGRAAYGDLRLPNSYELPPTIFETTGLYVVRREYAFRRRRRINMESRTAIWLSKIEAVDINTEEDFQFAEIVWRGMQCSQS